MKLCSRKSLRLLSAQLPYNFFHALSLLFWHFINTAAYHLGRYEPSSSPQTKELHPSSLWVQVRLSMELFSIRKRRLVSLPKWICCVYEMPKQKRQFIKNNNQICLTIRQRRAFIGCHAPRSISAHLQVVNLNIQNLWFSTDNDNSGHTAACTWHLFEESLALVFTFENNKNLVSPFYFVSNCFCCRRRRRWCMFIVYGFIYFYYSFILGS